jgi:hypothetical protein
MHIHRYLCVTYTHSLVLGTVTQDCFSRELGARKLLHSDYPHGDGKNEIDAALSKQA